MKVIVIGAGPSGLMCSIHLANRGFEVILLEKNGKAGKKIYITGKGRCNVTNNCTEKDFINNIVSNPNFLHSAYKNFTSQNTMEFFESRNVPLVTERGNRVFPESYKASDITDCLVNECLKLNVKVQYFENVYKIEKDNEKFIVKTYKGKYEGDRVIIATGGKSYPLTGSTGDGYKFAYDFHHKVIDPVPGLNAIRIKEKISPILYNFTLKNVKLSVTTKDKKLKHEEFGDLIFYKEGVAGPIALTTSSLINRQSPININLELDFKPALDEKQLDARLLREIKANPKQQIYDLIRKIIPREAADLYLQHLENIDLKKKVSEMSKNERTLIIQCAKHYKFTYLGLDVVDHAIVTSGGICVDEINQKTMESKLTPGLYFIGEVLDVDAFTGGFNMQIAFSTGAQCGDNLK